MSTPEQRVNTAVADVARTLADDAVHVWQLDYQRQQRRAPLIAVLAAYLNIEATGVSLIAGEFGRPALDPRHGSTLDFNWSHSGSQALVAIARDLAPGIDIERVRARPRALLIAERYFCAEETAMLAALTEAQRPRAFLELWTAKEAVLKALGRGIAFGLNRVSVAGAAEQLTLRRLDGEDTHRWQLQRVDAGAGYIAALAWRGGPRSVRLGTLAIPL